MPHTNVNPRVSIVKTRVFPVGRPAGLGETNVFTIAVSNVGNYPLDVVPVEDRYDTALLKYLGAVPASDDNVDDGQLAWANVGPLGVGAGTVITARFVAVSAGLGTNVVVTVPSTTNNVPVPGMTSSVPYSAVADALGLVKAVTRPVGRPAAIGEPVEFTITVTNKGPAPVLVVPLTDNFDTNLLSYVSASPAETTRVGGTLYWGDLGYLGIGGSTVVTTRFVAVTNGIGTNYVITTSTTNDVPHTNVNPRVSIVKTLISPVGVAAQIGEQVVFRVAVSNLGDVALDTVPLKDQYEITYLTFAGAEPAADDMVNDGELNWSNIGPLKAGGSTNVYVRFTARGGTPAPWATNTVVVTPTTTNGVPVLPQTNTETYIVDESLDIDNVSTGAFKYVASGVVPHTVLAISTNHLLVAGISVNNTPEARGTITNVMYGLIPMTPVGTRTNDDKVVSIWVLKDPPVGTTNVFVRFNRAPGEGWVVGVVTFRNVDQTVPYGAFSSNIGNSGDPYINSLSASLGEVIIDTVSLQCSNVTASGATQIQRWVRSSPPVPPGYATGGGSMVRGGTNVTMSWTAPDNAGTWAIGALAIRPHRTLTKLSSQTALESSKNPSLPGESVTFTATVTGTGPTPSGTVQFKIDGMDYGGAVTMSGGVAYAVVSNMAAGSHTVLAEYSGDASYGGSSSPGLVQDVEGTVTLAITGIRIQDGCPVIEWPGTASWNFTVETTPSLLPLVAWSNLTGYVDIPGVNATMTATDTNAFSDVRFYRVRMTK